jgi:hypothetical protein
MAREVVPSRPDLFTISRVSSPNLLPRAPQLTTVYRTRTIQQHHLSSTSPHHAAHLQEWLFLVRHHHQLRSVDPRDLHRPVWQIIRGLGVSPGCISSSFHLRCYDQ